MCRIGTLSKLFFLINIIFKFEFSEGRHHVASARIRRRSVAQTIYSFASHSHSKFDFIFSSNSEHRLERQREDIEWPEDDDDDIVKTEIDDFEVTPDIPINHYNCNFRPSNFILGFALTTFQICCFLFFFSIPVTEYTEITARSGKNTLYAETRIELGAQSQLLAVAGSTVQIYYEITNLRAMPTFHNFQVVDEQRFLQTLNPQSYVYIISLL